ncbi:MAG: succinylglutamate desuccinylase/aspartoacylase family protein [Cyclobacteriaceae bacterium]
MKINGTEILPGEEAKVSVNIARLPSHTPIDISMTISRAKEPGPVLLLMGGLHGDEINGIEIVRRIVEKGYNKPLIGTVICMPILNVYGFIHFSRYVPDGKDVNRSFPGNRHGSLASRVANYMSKDILPDIDYGIDFHTGGADRTNYPQVRAVLKDPKNMELANAFHAPFTIDSKYRPNSMRWMANKLGKKILVFEGGESSRFDEFAIEQGIKGTMRLMKHLGMTAFAEEASHPNLMIKSSTWIRASSSGMFLSEVKYGQKVERKQLLGFLTDPFGEFKQEIKASKSGYVIGLNHNPILHQGDAVMHIGSV